MGKKKMKFDNIEDLKANIGVMINIFDGIRIVDPITKEVVHTIRGGYSIQPFMCYQFWGNDKICDNCSSMRAINENRIVTKIGGNNSGIFTVTSLPIQIAEKHLSLEIIQDVTGNLCLENGEPFENQQRIMHSISAHIDHLITTDELTGLYNRRFINERLANALFSVHESGHPLSVLYIDIDFFKEINNTYGHDAGDRVIKGVAELLCQNMRQDDGWVARYGGDEFVVCLPDIDNNAAIRIAERMRKAVAEREFRIDSNKIHLTCSFGVHTIHYDDHPITVQKFLAHADKNLYKAKNSGRNQVMTGFKA